MARKALLTLALVGTLGVTGVADADAQARVHTTLAGTVASPDSAARPDSLRPDSVRTDSVRAASKWRAIRADAESCRWRLPEREVAVRG